MKVSPVYFHSIASFIIFVVALYFSFQFIDRDTFWGSVLIWAPFYLIILYLFGAWQFHNYLDRKSRKGEPKRTKGGSNGDDKIRP